MRTSVLAVNYYGDQFRDLLIRSVEDNQYQDNEVLIYDNSRSDNIGHGPALDELVKQATGQYIFVLDIDSHILLRNFDKRVVDHYLKLNDNDPSGKYRMIAAEGGQLKPVRPCFMFFEKDFFIENDMSFVAQECNGVKFDVGIHFYFKTLSLGYKVDLFRYAKTQYENVNGNEYLLLNERICYHHWYGTRWYNVHGKRVHNEIDGLKYSTWKERTNNLFKQYG